MKNAETVTFGGSGLDRAAHLRTDADAMARMRADPTTRILPLWRGKPLLAGEGLALLPADTTALGDLWRSPIFLGLDEDGPRFACDVSEWEPPAGTPDMLDSFLDASEQYVPGLPDDHRFAELRAVMTTLTPREAELAATAKAIASWHLSHGFCAKCGAKSHISHAGWQSTCPDCGTHHFPRTDPVVIMLITRGNKVLLGRSPHWPEGMYSLLAGFIEPGEPIEAAVRREVFEESGIRVGAVRYLASQPWPFPASLMFGCHGEALSDEITLDPVELEDAIWMSREDLADVFAGTNTTIKAARKGAIAHFLLWNWLADKLD